MGTRTRIHDGTEYEVTEAHPAADVFPWMPDDELRALADDVRANGLKEPVELLPDGRLLDGRNRELACRVAGVVPTYLTRHDVTSVGAVVALILSRNVHRRHLTPGQRAMAAAELAKLKSASEEQEIPGGGRASTDAGHVGQNDAAALMGVSRSSVTRAAKVAEAAPELVAAVKAGSLGVATAAEVAKLPRGQRKKVAESADPKATAKKVLAESKAEPARPDPGSGVLTITEDDERAAAESREAGVMRDAEGNAVPPNLKDTFGDPELREVLAELDGVLGVADGLYQRVTRSLSRKPLRFCQFQQCVDALLEAVHPKTGSLVRAIDHLKCGVPHVVCSCGGAVPAHKPCRGTGYLPHWRAEELKKEAA